MRVLVVPDKFKGTLTAKEAARAIAAGWTDERPEDVIETLPMSDGGEGFGEVFGELLNAEHRKCTTKDSAGHDTDASWWFDAATNTAIVEAAQANGIAALPPGRYHPFQLDTFGVAAIIKVAAQTSARRIYVGLGGSATNDGGFGAARAFGWRFLDERGHELRAWTDLDSLTHLQEPSRPLLPGQELIVAVDVANPLLGPNGATQVYGPQKGLLGDELARSEACLQRLADVVATTLGHGDALEPGSGAAGGLGFGLCAFLNGRLCSGARVFAELADLEHRIAKADSIITAEGCFDAQSLMGKGVGEVAASCERVGKRCLCLAGQAQILPQELPWSRFSVLPIVPTLTDREQSHLRAATWLRRLAARAASDV